jgi:hypothetical protein
MVATQQRATSKRSKGLSTQSKGISPYSTHPSQLSAARNDAAQPSIPIPDSAFLAERGILTRMESVAHPNQAAPLCNTPNISAA